jgi:hypothetical protein
MEEPIHIIEMAMIILAIIVASTTAALLGAIVERWIIRPIGKRRRWW